MKTRRAPLRVPQARQTPRTTTCQRPGCSELLSCNALYSLGPVHVGELTIVERITLHQGQLLLGSTQDILQSMLYRIRPSLCASTAAGMQ